MGLSYFSSPSVLSLVTLTKKVRGKTDGDKTNLENSGSVSRTIWIKFLNQVPCFRLPQMLGQHNSLRHWITEPFMIFFPGSLLPVFLSRRSGNGKKEMRGDICQNSFCPSFSSSLIQHEMPQKEKEPFLLSPSPPLSGISKSQTTRGKSPKYQSNFNLYFVSGALL